MANGETEVRFVTAVTDGGSVIFLPAVYISPFSLFFCVFINQNCWNMVTLLGVIFLAWKSGCVKFLTNLVSVGRQGPHGREFLALNPRLQDENEKISLDLRHRDEMEIHYLQSQTSRREQKSRWRKFSRESYLVLTTDWYFPKKGFWFPIFSSNNTTYFIGKFESKSHFLRRGREFFLSILCFETTAKFNLLFGEIEDDFSLEVRDQQFSLDSAIHLLSLSP